MQLGEFRLYSLYDILDHPHLSSVIGHTYTTLQQVLGQMKKSEMTFFVAHFIINNY